MPKTRKSRKGRSKKGGIKDPYEMLDNKNRLIGYKNRRGQPAVQPLRVPTPPPGYDSSSDESRISPSGSESSYSSLSSDGLTPALRSCYEIMGDAAATPPPRLRGSPRRLNLNLGLGALKRKSRKNRKSRKSRKFRKNRKQKKTTKRLRR